MPLLRSRRGFLKDGLAGAVAATPAVVPGSALGLEGRTAPSNRVTLAAIGLGFGWPMFLRHDVQYVAVCDVRRERREQGKAAVDARQGGTGCRAYNDFREVLARQDIDAVYVATPDHWHALVTIAAARAGKHVYCQKPLTRTIAEGRAVVEAVRRQTIVFQHGTQQRHDPPMLFGCELVLNGYIGQLKHVRIGSPAGAISGPWRPEPVPEGLDYEMWLGPAPWAPYHKDRCLYRFRFNLDYSGGQVTNFGAHSNDAAQWAMGTDDSGPIEVEDLGSEWPPKGCLYNTATKTAFRARYANGVELICKTDRPGFGVRFEGTEGWVEYGYQGVKTHPESLKTSKIGAGEIHLPVSNPQRIQEAGKYHVPDHVRNFLDSIRSRQDPIAPVSVGHRSATVCHLGNIAMLLKRKLQWDPVAEQFAGDDEANRLLSRPMRAPWTL